MDARILTTLALLLTFYQGFHAQVVLPLGPDALGAELSTLRSNPLKLTPEELGQLVSGTLIFNRTTPGIGEQCKGGLLHYTRALMLSQPWAAKLVDAWGRSEDGYYDGNTFWLGNYDECLATREPVAEGIRGKMCLSFFNTVFPAVGWSGVGMCVPQDCTHEETRWLLNAGTSSLNYNLTVGHCVKDNEFGKDGFAIATVVIIGVVFLLIVVATVFDICISRRRAIKTQVNTSNPNSNASEHVAIPLANGIQKQNEQQESQMNSTIEMNGVVTLNGVTASEIQEPTSSTLDLSKRMETAADTTVSSTQQLVSPPAKESLASPPMSKCARLLLAFSFYTNARNFFSMKQHPGSLTCIHGIRFLSMTWILLGHTGQLGISTNRITPTTSNNFQWFNTPGEYYQRYTYMLFNNSEISVDSFFVIGAMLVTLSFLRQTEKNGGKPTGKQMLLYYVHRYWRLTPVFAFVLMFYVTMFYHLGNGPLKPTSFVDVDSCRTDWWRLLTYINTMWYSPCMGHSWYLGNDFFFYCVAPFFIWLTIKFPKKGWIGCLCGIIGSIAITIGLSVRLYVMGQGNHFGDIYCRPYTRIVTYLIGILLGYVTHKTKAKWQISEVKGTAIFTVAIVVVSWIVWTYHYSQYGQVGAVIMESIRRPLFAISISAMIYLCITGNGGFINSILSYGFWVPLSKLTYTSYLIHPPLMYIVYFSRTKQIYMTDLDMTYYFCGHFMITLGLSFIVTMMFEIPMLGLEKVLLPHRKKE